MGRRSGLMLPVSPLFQKMGRRDAWNCLSLAAIPFACCLVAQSCPTLCGLMDCSLPGSSVHKVLQARMLDWLAISSSRDLLLDPAIKPESAALTGGFFITLPPGKPLTVHYFFFKEIFEDKRFFHLSCCILNITFKTLITFMNTFLDNDQNPYSFYCYF